MRITATEAQTQKACMDLLAAERIFALRLNSGAVKDKRGVPVYFARWTDGSPAAGVADVLALPVFLRLAGPGPIVMVPSIKVVWIECKAATGQRKTQREFQARVEAEGHTYLIVRDAAELQAWLRERRGRA